MRRSMADLMNKPTRRIVPAFSLLVLSGLIFGFPREARAQTWNGSVSDLWSNVAQLDAEYSAELELGQCDH